MKEGKNKKYKKVNTTTNLKKNKNKNLLFSTSSTILRMKTKKVS